MVVEREGIMVEAERGFDVTLGVAVSSEDLAEGEAVGVDEIWTISDGSDGGTMSDGKLVAGPEKIDFSSGKEITS